MYLLDFSEVSLEHYFYDAYIIALCETWLLEQMEWKFDYLTDSNQLHSFAKKKTFKRQSQRWYFNIYKKKSIKSDKLIIDPNRLFIKLSLNKRKIILGVIYFYPNVDVSNLLENLKEVLPNNINTH